MQIFNPNNYTSVPTLNSALTISLVQRLISEMPVEVVQNPLTAVAAERMRSRAMAMRTERIKLLSLPEKVDTRPLDQGEDNAWGAIYVRLEGYAKLPDAAETRDDSRRASALLAQLFPTGLSFLTLDYQQQWVESQRRLDMIEQQELAPQLDRLCGPVFLQQLLVAHQAYGEALGLTGPRPQNVEPPAIAEALRALRDGIRFYARRVLALADEEEAESIPLVQRALAPLLEAQDQVRARRAQGQPEPEPADEGELPPLPAV